MQPPPSKARTECRHALAEYAGDTVRARGTISTIARDGSVTFQQSHVGTFRIICEFKTREEVVRLKRGQQITFTARIHDVHNRTAYLNSCSRQ